MPFTPSHAIAAIALHRLFPRWSLSAFVVGTMAPDFEYLLRLAPQSTISHTPIGSLVFCVPTGLVGWALWKDVILPGFAGEPGSSRKPPGARGWFLAGCAVWMGAASHMAWDSFTHPAGWMVRQIELLGHPVGSGLAVPWYKVLQHGSSLVGALAIAAWLWSRYGVEVRSLLARPGFAAVWLARLGLVLLGALLGGSLDSFPGGSGARGLDAGRFVVGFLDGAFVAVVALALVARRRGGKVHV